MHILLLAILSVCTGAWADRTDVPAGARRFGLHTCRTADAITLLVAGDPVSRETGGTYRVTVDRRIEAPVRNLLGTPADECAGELVFDGRYPYLTQTRRHLFLSRLMISRFNRAGDTAILLFEFVNPDGFMLPQRRIVRMPLSISDTCPVEVVFANLPRRTGSQVRDPAAGGFLPSMFVQAGDGYSVPESDQAVKKTGISALSGNVLNKGEQKNRGAQSAGDQTAVQSFSGFLGESEPDNDSDSDRYYDFGAKPLPSAGWNIKSAPQQESQAQSDSTAGGSDGFTFGPGPGPDYHDDAPTFPMRRGEP